jgi:uncharacterized membrane protein YdjX (TVP38/TMEM64 family)
LRSHLRKNQDSFWANLNALLSAIMSKTKITFFFVILLVIAGFYFFDADKFLSLENVQTNIERIKILFEESPFFVISLFSGIYILMTSFSIPGSIVLTLLSGSIFGVLRGALLVTLCGAIGASLAFLMSRYIFRDTVLNHFKEKFEKLNKKLNDDGISYLLTMRLIPVSPFVIINLLMGVTTIRLWTFAWTTFVGMLPGAFIYVYAGRKIAQISSPSEILTWPIIIVLSLLGLMPLIIKWLISTFHDKSLVSDT